METENKYQKAPFHGLGAMRWKKGRISLVGAVLDYANLQGDMDVEARKVIAAMRALPGGCGWAPRDLSVSRVKTTMRKIKSRLKKGEIMVSTEVRAQSQKDYTPSPRRAAAAAARNGKPHPATGTPAPAPASSQTAPSRRELQAQAAGLGAMVTKLENLKTALELALEEVNDLLS